MGTVRAVAEVTENVHMAEVGPNCLSFAINALKFDPANCVVYQI